MISIAKIAREIGVSPAAVSHVLNGRYSKVSAVTRNEIEVALRKHRYHRNGLVRSLKSQRTNSLAVFLPSVRYGFYAQILDSMEARARQKGYHLFVVQTHSSTSILESEINHLCERRVDGFGVSPIHSDHKICQDLWLAGTPLVLIDSYIPGSTIPFVDTDDKLGAVLAAEHLLALGHRSFFVHAASPQDHTPMALQRYEGYMETLHKAGVTEITEFRGSLGIEHGYGAVKEALAAGKKFTAILAATDMAAIGAERAVQEAGLSVPGDVAVIGYGNLEEGRFVTPPLSTIHQSPDRMGIACVDMLIDVVENGVQPKPILFPPELIVRESTVAPKSTETADWISSVGERFE